MRIDPSPSPSQPTTLTASRTFGRWSWRSFRGPALFIPLLVFIVFSPALKAGLLNWDDDTHVTGNPNILSLSPHSVQNIFSSFPNKTYIPLTLLSFAVEHRLFGFNPLIFHLNNILLHAAVAFLIVWFLLQCGLSREGALFGGILFAIHPMHVESVAWVTARKDVLYSFFYVLALIFYVEYFQTKKTMFYWLSLLAGLLSILSKPMALSLPLILLLCDWFFRRDWTPRLLLEKIPYILVIFPVAWLTYYFNARIPGQNPAESGLIFFWTFSFYLQKFFWPFGLIPLYSLPKPIALSQPEYGMALFWAVVFVSGLVIFRKKRPVVFAGLFYFFSVFFLLRLDDLKDTNIVADRFMYLPSLGICLLAGCGLERLLIYLRKKPSKVFLAAGHGLVGLLIFFLAVQTHFQTKIWKDDLTLWNAVIAENPNHELAYNSRAVALSKAGRQDLALLNLSKAIELRGDYAKAYYNRARIMVMLGKDQLALKDFSEALKINPRYDSVYMERGILLSRNGSLEAAISDFNKAIQLNPHCHSCYNNRGITYKKMGDHYNALFDYTRAIVANRNFFEAYYNRMSLYAVDHNWTNAIDDATRCLSLKPDDVTLLLKRGEFYLNRPSLDLADHDFNRASQIDPANGAAYYYKALLFAARGDRPKMKENLQRARALGFAEDPNRLDQDIK